MPTKQRDQRPFNVAYYAAHREQEIERVTSRQRATLEWLRDIRDVPCMDCGERFAPYVMQFDHRDPSQKSFSLAAGHALLKSRAVLLSEIAKCDIVCANCHRMRTHAGYLSGLFALPVPVKLERTPERDRSLAKYHRARAAQLPIVMELRSRACQDCGRVFPWYVMEFDHRDATTKYMEIARMVGRVGMRRLLEELAKCDIVCANCHAERTYHRRLCSDTSCTRVWCSGHACDPSKIEGRVRFSSPAPSAKPPQIGESATPYLIAA